MAIVAVNAISVDVMVVGDSGGLATAVRRHDIRGRWWGKLGSKLRRVLQSGRLARSINVVTTNL